MTLRTINSYLPVRADMTDERGVGYFRYRSYSFYEPFVEGFRHLREGLFFHRRDEESPSLQQRVIHLMVGFCLLIPIVGQKLFMSLSEARPSSLTHTDRLYKREEKESRSYRESMKMRIKPHQLISIEREKWAQQELFFSTDDHLQFRSWFETGRGNNYLKQQALSFGHGTALHCLAMRVDDCNFLQLQELTRLALEEGVDVAIQDRCGNTALHWAIANACNRTALQILENMPEERALNLQCMDGNTALHLSIAKGYTTLSRNGESLSCPNSRITNALLQKRANPNLQNSDGNSPLHLACVRRDPQSIQVLLHAGADKTLLNKMGKTAKQLFEIDYYDAVSILHATTGGQFLLNKRIHAANSVAAALL